MAAGTEPDPLVRAAASQLARDALWRDPPPLAGGCEHDLELLPVIEPRFTVVCRKCGGLDVTASRAIGSASPDAPEYVILGDSSVRPLRVRDPSAVPGFKRGDKVWPREGPMVFQRGPQTVIGMCRHPVAGDWLWLDDGECGFRSRAAAHWTTEEPGEAEVAARKERASRLQAEDEKRLAEWRKESRLRWQYPVAGGPAGPVLPVPVDEPRRIADA